MGINMTRFQYYMLKLIEESNEVAKEACKCSVFGWNSYNPADGIPNIARLHDELNDLAATIEVLNEEYGLNFKVDQDKVRAKRQKMEKYRLLVEQQTQ